MSEEKELPEGWVRTRVGEIYDIVGGGTPSTDIEEYWNGDIAWITSADIYGLKDIRPRKRITKAAIENSATNVVPEKSLIVVTRVGLGKVALAKMPLCFSQDSQALIDNSSSIYPDYSLYYLAQAVQVFKYQNRGTTIAGVTKKQLSELPFALPPLSEQHRIVEAIEQQFTRLDVGVAALQRARTKLKRYRAAVLKAAVEGKLTEAWRAEHPTTEPTSVLLERILEERRAKWEADVRAKGKDPAKVRYVEPAAPDVEGLPELPEGWCWATLGRVAIFQNGRSFQSNEYTSEGVKLLRPGNLYADGTVKWTITNTRCMPETWAERNPDLIVRDHELVMNLTAQSLKDEFLGRICITSRNEYCLLNQRLARITTLEGFDRLYALYMLKSAIFRRFVDGLNKGSLIQHMFTSQLTDFCFPLPSLAEQEQIVAEVERRLSVISQLEVTVEANLRRAERLRQSILREAFAGRLVEQDPSDEPAGVLLERIRGERGDRERKNGVGGSRSKSDRGRVVRVPEPGGLDVVGMGQVELWEGEGVGG